MLEGLGCVCMLRRSRWWLSPAPRAHTVHALVNASSTGWSARSAVVGGAVVGGAVVGGAVVGGAVVGGAVVGGAVVGGAVVGGAATVAQTPSANYAGSVSSVTAP
jgi:hypothetical protein